jgi:alpha-beta hydrolase superfamily lysophospholipase
MTPVGRSLLVVSIWMSMFSTVTFAQTSEKLVVRGKIQTLQLYGPRDGDPVIVSSGDGGWIHLGPHVATMLAARGFFVVGFDTKAYLESFTSGTSTLSTADVPADYRDLLKVAVANSTKKPVLIGVSEGAALSLLAATDAATKAMVSGVIGLGLGNRNELGWRWKDAMIYLTHGIPNEPTFSAREIAPRLAPVPLGVINSTHDEYVPAGEVDLIMAAAGNPKRLWMIDAADHRFSNKPVELAQCLAEALDWVRQNAPR